MLAPRFIYLTKNIQILNVTMITRFISSKQESERMKKFHEKLKSEIPSDPLLIETDPKSGEFLPDSEKEPTKWGDWQNGGRVTDF